MKYSIPCDDPYLRNDFSSPLSHPPIEDHGFYQEVMMTMMKYCMDKQQVYLE